MGFGAGGDAFAHYPRPVFASGYGDEFLKRKAGDGGGFPDLVVHNFVQLGFVIWYYNDKVCRKVF